MAKNQFASRISSPKLVESVEVETPKIKPRPSWKFRLGLAVGKSLILLGVCVWLGQLAQMAMSVGTAKAMEMKDQLLEKLTVTKVVAEYKEPDQATLWEIIIKVSRENGIDPLILTVLAEKESRGGEALYRFEPGKYQEFLTSKKYRSVPQDEVRMIASSHGVFHIMGYSAQDYCGLTWHQLYNTWTSARCAASIVGRIYKETSGIKAPGDHVREVFKRYNGSGEMAEKYADDAMNRLAKILYKGMVGKG